MSEFRDLLESSSIFRGVIAVIEVLVGSYIVINGIQPPDWWAVQFGAVVSFYFAGAISNQSSKSTIRAYAAGQAKPQ